jgi:RNA polymerase sigma-70 factor, ECF subfamily
MEPISVTEGGRQDDWLRAAMAGSGSALGRLLDSYRSYLLLVVGQQLGADVRTKVAVSDIVQEAFLAAQKGFNTFRGATRAEFLEWLRTLLLNTLSNQRRSFTGTEMRQLGREVPLETIDCVLPARTPSPSRTAESREEARAVEHALASLSDDYRQVIVWRNREDRSFAQIGEALGRSEEAARKLWARAVLALKDRLADPL